MIGKIRTKFQSLMLHQKIHLVHSVIICGSILSLVIFISFVASYFLIQQKIQNSMKDCTTISEKLDLQLSSYEQDALTIILNQEYQEMLTHLDESATTENVIRAMNFATILADFYSSHTNVHAIRFYDLINENVYNNYVENRDWQTEESWETVYDFVDSKTKSEWTKFAIENPPKAHFSFLHRVSNYSGKFVGVLELIIDEMQINQIYQKLETSDSSFVLVDSLGRIVSSSNKNELGKNISDESYYRFVVENSGDGKLFKIDGTNCLVTGSKYEKLGYQIISISPTKTVIRDVGVLISIILMIGFISIIVATVLERRTTTKTTLPVVQILQVVDRVSNGDFTARVEKAYQNEFQNLGLSLNRMIENMIKMMAQIQQQSDLKRKYELEYIQMQLNPHFLYNSMETICGIIESEDSRLAIRVIQLLSQFYRGVLSRGDTLITIDQEIQITLRYLEIMRIRYGSNFSFDYSFPDKMMSAKIPKLILQPLVENSVLHGFHGRNKNYKLRLRGKILDRGMEIRIIDNGVGMEQELISYIMSGKQQETYKGSGFGVHSVDERIKLAFGTEYGLSIHSKRGIGTMIRIYLPLKEQEEKNEIGFTGG